jgi:hypothetical protein
VVAGEATTLPGPAERPLDHPPPRLHGEAVLVGLWPDQFDGDRSGRSDARPGGGAVRVAQRDRGPRATRRSESRDPAVAAVQVGGGGGGEQEAAVRVHQGMALAVDNVLGGIVAASSCIAHTARVRGLSIHHHRGGRGAMFVDARDQSTA